MAGAVTYHAFCASVTAGTVKVVSIAVPIAAVPYICAAVAVASVAYAAVKIYQCCKNE